MSRIRLLATLTLFGAFSFACSADESAADVAAKGEESAVPEPSAKTDSWFAPTLHGDLVFGVMNEAEITDDEHFHAWDFTLTDSADVALTTSAEPSLDTVMYLYRRSTEHDSWGAYVERNDDHDGTTASHIEGTFGAGSYRVMVKGYKDSLRGPFGVLGSCSGAGCPDVAVADPLTEEQAAAIINAFDNICPDTFCGGDFNYYGAEVTCEFAAKSCTMVFDAQSYYEEDILPMTALDDVSDTDRTVTGVLSNEGGTYVGTLLEMVDKGEDGVWLRSSCQLTGSYDSVDDLYDTSSSYPSLNDTFYEQFLECLEGLEGRFYAL